MKGKKKWQNGIKMLMSVCVVLFVMIISNADSVRASVKPQISCSSVRRIGAGVADAWIYSDTAGYVYYVVDTTDGEASTLMASEIVAQGNLSSQVTVAGKIVTERITAGMSSGVRYAHIVVVDQEDSSAISNIVTVKLPKDYWFSEDFEAYPDSYNSTSYTAGFGHGPRSAIYEDDGNKVYSVQGDTSEVASVETGQLNEDCITVAESYIKSTAASPTASLKLQFYGSLSYTQNSFSTTVGYDIAGVKIEDGVWKSYADGIGAQVLDNVVSIDMTKDTRYKVRIVYDTEKHQYDVYIDGKKANS